MGRVLKRLARLLGAAVIVAPLIAVATATNASADTWPFNSNFRPDTGYHSYCYSVITPSSAVKTQMYNAMVYMTDATQANRTYHSSCDLSGAGQTDVVWREEGTTSDSWIGSAQCVVFWSGSSPARCDRYFVKINGALVRAHYSSSTYEANQWRKTACHELGHTLGLDHYPSPYDDSCQRSGWTGTSSAAWTRTWTVHHRDHINAWF